MALFGAVGEYVEGEEDWSQYVERLGHFFGANAVTPGRPQWRTGPGTGTPRCYRCLRSGQHQLFLWLSLINLLEYVNMW